MGGHGGGGSSYGSGYGGYPQQPVYAQSPPKKHGGGMSGGTGLALGGKHSVFRFVSQSGPYVISLSLAGAGLLGGLLIADVAENIYDDGYDNGFDGGGDFDGGF